jgi:addiction module HigA family antidote
MVSRIPTHPGALLREDVLPALNLSVSAAATSLGVSRQMLHRILAEKAPVTPEMAVRLGKFCGDGPGIWVRMQAAHDVAKAEIAMASIVKRIPKAKAA